MRIRLMIIGLALTAGISSAALAQRVLRSKDAPAPIPATAEDAGPPPGGSAPPGQSQPDAASQKKHKKGEPVAAVDAGPVVPPSFKDDLTPAEIARANATANAHDCSSGRCEALY
jgi:hypothetical protein